MCGIVGVASQTETIDRSLLESMLSTIGHRGPNHAATRIDHSQGETVGLGYCRLSILDLSPAGNQPMSNEGNNIWIVYNGELYNHAELRAELEAKGHLYRSRTDTETVIHAYEEWGCEAFARFNGMFAFALYDQNAGSLILARDRRGIKPLYYTWDGHTLSFASELKALLGPGLVQPRIDPTALWLFLCLGYIPSPYSIIQGVRKLEPGHYVALNDSDLQVVSFVSPAQQIAHEGNEHDVIHLVHESIEDAVKRQLMSDVPVGVFLSGGLDSTIVASLAARHHNSPLHTFSVGYARASSANEIESRYNEDFYYARQIAQSLGTVHHEVVVENDQALPDLFTQLVGQLDEPMVEPVFLSTHYLSQLARNCGVPVILTGDGADELFGGYDRYFSAQRLAAYRKVPGLRWALPFIEAVGGDREVAKSAHELKYLLDHPDASESYIRFSSIYRPDQALKLLMPNLQMEVDPDALCSLVQASIPPSAEFVDQMAHADLVLWVGEHFNPRLDRISMLHSVEARVPFQDDAVVAAALSIPTSMKSNRGSRKGLLKDAFADVIPDLARTRPKRSFQAPSGAWLQGGLNELYQEMVKGNMHLAEVLNPEIVTQYAAEWGKSTPGQVFAISALLIAELWFRQYVAVGEH